MNRLIIPGTIPSVNHQYKNVMRNGRRMRVLTDVAEQWKYVAILFTRQWMNKNKWSTTSSKVIVCLWYYFPNNNRRDTHNTLKLLLDALEDAGIYTDDRFALPHIMNYELDRENPRVEIEFELMDA